MGPHRNGVAQNGELSNGHSVENSIAEELLIKSKIWRLPINSKEFAKRLDEEDPLREYRKLFHYPKKKNIHGVDLRYISEENEECIYMCGQSLGLQLKSAQSKVSAALNNWASRAVECHFNGDFPAVYSDQVSKEKMSALVGAEPSEIAFMNGLTVNIHLMLATFYKPTAERNKILMIAGGFHSDWYALQSHVTLRGFDPQESIILLHPKQGKHTIDGNDILSAIRKEGKNIALVYVEGVHYYTGQVFDMKRIAQAGHEQGCVVGYDLAHAVGNVKVELHEWEVDFAIWCTYKYLNSGPGNMGVVFCHSKHTRGPNQVMPALRGWWGLDIKRKFAFDKDFTPAEGADRFSLSNPPPVLSAMILSSLEVFYEVGMEKIQRKQRLITGYLEYLLKKNLKLGNVSNGSTENNNGSTVYNNVTEPSIEIITPNDPKERGSQISLLSSIPIKECEELLKQRGIICDIRSPSVVRVTPAPLYNTFSEVQSFVNIFKNIWEGVSQVKKT